MKTIERVEILPEPGFKFVPMKKGLIPSIGGPGSKECCRYPIGCQWEQRTTTTGNIIYNFHGREMVRGVLRCGRCGNWSAFDVATIERMAFWRGHRKDSK